MIRSLATHQPLGLLGLACGALTLATFAPGAHAAPAVRSEATGYRLIETAPGQSSWLSGTEIGELSVRTHAAGRCPGFMDITAMPDEPTLDVSRALELLVDFPNRRLHAAAAIDRALPEIRLTNLNDTVAKLSSYKNRHHKTQLGADSAAWIESRFKALAGNRSDITVERVVHSFAQPSIIATIRGSGPKAAEIIVIGAHEDSINHKGLFPDANRVAPGADDDASGIATVLEAFRVLAESNYQPQRTIEFIAYAGEEGGLLGSQDIARAHKRAGKNVIAAIQFDMTMYPGTAQKITFVSDNVDRPLTDFTKTIVDAYVREPWTQTECGYGCSDHSSWTKQGYPSVFPFEAAMDAHNPKIHSADDTIANMDPSFGVRFAKLGVAFLLELGTDPARN